MRHVKRPKHGGANESIRAGIVIAFAAALLLPATASALDPPEPQSVLFVANGYYQQETIIRNHLLSSGAYTVAVKKDYQIKGTTDLSPYDVVILTEFAPNVSTAGINNIKASGKPVLIVEYWDFWYSYRFGLVETDDCGYVGTNFVESVSAGIDEYSWYVGREPDVYTSTYAIYGIAAADVTEGVSKLYYSSRSFDEIAVLFDASQRVAATGVYDTRRYTAEAWRLFDRLLQMLAPQQVTWENPWEMPQALADSGLLTYVEAVNRNPERYTVAEVEARLWADLSRWRILELAGFVSDLVRPAFPGFDLLPDLRLDIPDLPHPERCGYHNQRWLLGAHWARNSDWTLTNRTCTDYYLPDDTTTWPNDIHGSVSDLNYTGPVWNSDKVGGVDMGVNTRLWDRTYFYMGDTWVRGLTVGKYYEQDPDWCDDPVTGFLCDSGAVRNDAIAISVDDDPTDGVDLTVFSESTGDPLFPSTFRGLGIPGVHNDSPAGFWDFIPGFEPTEPQFTTTSGATTVYVPHEVTMWLNGEPVTVVKSIPMVVVTYTSASIPPWGKWWGDENLKFSAGNCDPGAVTGDCDIPYSRKTPTAHVACSFDGIRFFACYGGGIETPYPLSEDRFEYTDCVNRQAVYGASRVGRFVQPSLVAVGAGDLEAMCNGLGGQPAYDSDSPMCWLHEGFPGYGGLLVMGQARPIFNSPLFLAFIKAEEIGVVEGGKPKVWYFTGEVVEGSPELSWSNSEADAAPLPLEDWLGELPCDDLSETSQGCESEIPPRHYPPENCQAGNDDTTFGPFPVSPVLVRAGTEDEFGVEHPQLLILYTKQPTSYRTAPLSAPWQLSARQTLYSEGLELYCPNRVDGYGNQIIHGSSSSYLHFEAEHLSFWHVISTWYQQNACCPEQIFGSVTKSGPYGTYTREATVPWPPTTP